MHDNTSGIGLKRLSSENVALSSFQEDKKWNCDQSHWHESSKTFKKHYLTSKGHSILVFNWNIDMLSMMYHNPHQVLELPISQTKWSKVRNTNPSYSCMLTPISKIYQKCVLALERKVHFMILLMPCPCRNYMHRIHI